MAWVSLLVDDPPYVLSRIVAGRINAVHATPRGEDNWVVLDPALCTFYLLLFTFAGLNLYPFAIMSGKCEYSHFSEFCESY